MVYLDVLRPNSSCDLEPSTEVFTAGWGVIPSREVAYDANLELCLRDPALLAHPRRESPQAIYQFVEIFWSSTIAMVQGSYLGADFLHASSACFRASSTEGRPET